MNNWVEINQDNLAGNFQALEQAIGPETKVLAVIKANAYGHGAELCAPVLARAGARWLGVTSPDEGVRVRRALTQAGISKSEIDLLVMSGSLPHETASLVEHDLVPVVWTPEQVTWLTGDPGLRVHVEIDTGMGRQGVEPGPELASLLTSLGNAGLTLDGVFTHFASAEVAHSPLTQQQQQRFEAAINQIREAGLRPRWVHAGNSSTVDNPAQPWPWLVSLAEGTGAQAMVRSGIALYGYCLPIEPPAEAETSSQLAGRLRPVMTWKTRVLAVRTLADGETVGYNATFSAERPMRVALLPVGYADGLRRELSSTNQRAGGWVMLHGQPAPILGRISMNLTVVDVTGIAGVAPNDVALLLGEGVTADDHARLAGTIAYEILCGVHPSA